MGGASTPAAPAPVAAAPPPASAVSAPVISTAQNQSNQAAAAEGMGMGGTILTSGAGLVMPASTSRKTLLGQ